MSKNQRYRSATVPLIRSSATVICIQGMPLRVLHFFFQVRENSLALLEEGGDSVNAREKSEATLSVNLEGTIDLIAKHAKELLTYRSHTLTGTYGFAMKKYVHSIFSLMEKLHAHIDKVLAVERMVATLFFYRPTVLVEYQINGTRKLALQKMVDYQEQVYKYLSTSYSASYCTNTKKRFEINVTKELSDSFNRNPYPNLEEAQRLCSLTGLSEKQVTMWFTNRRSRNKKKKIMGSEKRNDRFGTPSQAQTSSPPDSPGQIIQPSPTTPFKLGSEDDIFAENRRMAELEFYQMMVSSNPRNRWIEFEDFFRDLQSGPDTA